MDSNSDRKKITDKPGSLSPFAQILTAEMQRAPEGAISFARFMELALYHPDHGYYNRSQPIIGKSGDFYTSVSVGPLFGQLLAHFLQRENVQTIVEAGAHDGALARDILTANPRFNYIIVEPSPKLRAQQRSTLGAFKQVQWANEIPELEGAIISNELLDAFPCHLLRWSGQNWIELGVSPNFTFTPLPHRTIEPPEAIKPLEPHLPANFTIEHTPAAAAWWKAAAQKLRRGLLLAIDYGDEQHNLWTPNRPNGTLRAYKNHKLADDPLANPGEQDLTAHVNFTPLLELGGGELHDQSRFLSRIAADYFTQHPPTASQVRQLQTLTQHFAQFKVLVQRVQ